MVKADLILALRISLVDTEPEIWRRILVPYDINLAQFHEVMQSAMDWENQHLFEFRLDKSRYGIPHADFQDTRNPMRPARSITLKDAISAAGKRFRYVYDMGDYWVHGIVLEEVLSNDRGEPVLQCVGGSGRCPPEDVGGTFGYEEFLQAIAHPSHEAHAHYIDWIGGEFDPNHFDLEEINRRLSGIKRKLRRSQTRAKKRSP